MKLRDLSTYVTEVENRSGKVTGAVQRKVFRF